jgi:hypothetical protein
MFDVVIDLFWDDPEGDGPSLEISRTGRAIQVNACLSISEIQMKAACQELGSNGNVVFEAWAERMGLNLRPASEVAIISEKDF